MILADTGFPHFLTQIEQAEQSGADPRLIRMIKSIEFLDQVCPVSDKEEINKGVFILKTPGHMPGHISVYVEPLKILISRDILVSENGKLKIAEEQFVLDKKREIESLKKLEKMDICKIICYHGGEYVSENVQADLKRIIARGYKN